VIIEGNAWGGNRERKDWGISDRKDSIGGIGQGD
jgi:hypothetical protein